MGALLGGTGGGNGAGCEGEDREALAPGKGGAGTAAALSELCKAEEGEASGGPGVGSCCFVFPKDSGFLWSLWLVAGWVKALL